MDIKDNVKGQQTTISVGMPKTICGAICCRACKKFDDNIISYLEKHSLMSEDVMEHVQNLNENVMRTLCLLISQEFASYDELIEHIWEGRIVGSGSLPVVIHEVRLFLKKCPNINIVNIRTKGYMLTTSC